MRTLQSCLLDYSMAKLRGLAVARGVELTTNRQADAARYLADAMLSQDSVAEALEILDSEEQRVLETVQASGGQVRADPFVRRFGGIRPIGDGHLMAAEPWLAPETPVERLFYLALLFKGFAEYGGDLVEFYFIPTDVLPLLPPPHVQAQPSFAPIGEPAQMWEAGDAASVDICSLLALMQNERVRHVRGKGIGAKDRDAWQRRWTFTPLEPHPFSGYPDARSRCLLRLSARLRLIRREGKLVKPRADTARKWLSAPRGGRVQQMWNAWKDDAGWDELRQIPGIRCEGTGWSNDPAATRQRLLALFAACEPGAWYSLAQVKSAIREYAPDFQRTGGDYNSWYIRDVSTDEYLMGFEHWDDIEGTLIDRIVTGAMHWLGCVDVAPGHGDSGLAFRVTPLGHALLLGQEVQEDSRLQPIEVTGDGRVRWPPEGNLYHRFQVERFADWDAGHDGALYRITPESLARALAQGVKVESLLAFLEHATGDRIPAELGERIRTWARRRGRARLQRAVLLETDAPEVLEEIRGDQELAPYLDEAISPTCVRVHQDRWQELLARLRQKGFVA